MSDPVISVVMTAHNAGEHLRPAVASVLNQTMTDLEVLLVDDGSTDGSIDSIVDIDDDRIRLERQPQAGLGEPVNRWLRAARGQFIMRMDADDLIHPERARRQSEFLLANTDVGVVGSQYRFFTEHGDGPQSQLPLDHVTIVQGLERGWHTISHATTMYRTDLIRAGLAYSWSGPGEDWSFLGDASQMTRLAVLDEVLYYYRLHSESSAWRGARQSTQGLAYARQRLAAMNEGQEPVTQTEFLAERGSRAHGLLDQSRAVSGVLYRQAIIDQIEGRERRGQLTKAAAAALDPVKTAGWVKKTVAKRRSS